MINPHVILIGDIHKAGGYLPYAKSKLANLRKNSERFPLTRNFQVGADVFIHLEAFTNPILDKIIIKVKAGSDELYLESGFYEFYSLATCNKNTYRPAYLYYNTEVQTYMDSISQPLQGTMTLLDSSPWVGGEDLPERESLSVSCKTKVKQITVCDVTYKEETPTFCDTNAIRHRKQTQANVLSSLYTGKLRLFVQSLYGSKRTDYNSTEDYPFDDWPLFVNGVQLHYKGGTTSGLVSISDYNYLLVEVSYGGITYRRLIPSEKGERLRRHLVEHAGSMTSAEIQKTEAYILSTCKIESNTSTVTSNVADVFTNGGNPVEYGWHFNWDGSKADIVVHKNNLPHDNKFHAYHYRLTFTYTTKLTATLSAVESDKEWLPSGPRRVFVPLWIDFDMHAIQPPMNDPFSGWVWNYDWDAPVYCFYDNNDTLQVARMNNTVVTGGGSNNHGKKCGILSGDVYEENNVYAGGNLATMEVWAGSSFLRENWSEGSSFDKTVYHCSGGTAPTGAGGISDSSFICLTAPANTTTYHWSTVYGATTDGTGQHPIPGEFVDIPGVGSKQIYIRWRFRKDTPVQGDHYTGTDADHIAHQSIVIPYYDANSFYVGSRESLDNIVGGTHTANVPGVEFDYEVTFLKCYEHPITTPRVWNVYSELDTHEMSYHHTSGAGFGADDGVMTYLEQAHVRFLLCNANGTQQIEEERNADSSYLDIYLTSENLATSNAPVSFFPLGKLSVLGASFNQLDSGYAEDDNDYIQETSVGWA